MIQERSHIDSQISSHTTHHRSLLSNLSPSLNKSGYIEDETTSSSSLSTRQHSFQSQQFLLALNIAGVASFVLVTVFGLFQVDVFLRAYRLPLETFFTGNILLAVINTCSNFCGAFALDSLASRRERSDLLGLSGIMFAFFFLGPFFRWKEPDGFHFVFSLALYDATRSFNIILLGSLVTDNHHMSDNERVSFMASGKFANLLAAFLVSRIGLKVFDDEDLKQFQSFLKVLAIITALLFMLSQFLARYSIVLKWKPFSLRYTHKKKHDDGEDDTKVLFHNKHKKTRKVRLKHLRDFWKYKNFWAWIGMELLLESQVSFVNTFLKTFVDRLVYDAGESREFCDWFLSAIRPLSMICGVLIYFPIQKLGYQKVYPILFLVNACFCIFMLFAASYESTKLIMLFLAIHPTITSAVQASGFHLAMSDMVLEMKRMHASQGRSDEPSLAGLFMGVNALFCKPAEYLLPVVAASNLDGLELDLETSVRHKFTDSESSHAPEILFRLLVIPPLVFAILQWLSWRYYTLTPSKVNQIRSELLQVLP